MIHYIPDVQLAALREDIVDIEIEAKMKNLATTKMKKQFSISI